MNPVTIPYRAPPVKDNPNWPLPPDYHELEADQQQLYRLAVLKTQETPEDFVVAFLFFEAYYLAEYDIQDDGHSIPFFKRYVPNANFHLELLRDFHGHDHNVWGAPRGFAKSFKFALQLPMFLMVTRPNFSVALCLATDRMVGRRVEYIRSQLTRNERVIQDWGDLKYTRGEGLWSAHQISLKNGSSLEGFSVTGRKRGERPDLFLLDDPEYDPDKSTDVAALRDHLDRTVFKQIMPMLRSGSKFLWLGTTINRRGLLYHALQGDDPRFAQFNRRRYKAFEVLPDGTIVLLWPEMASYEWLMEQKKRMGAGNFSAEYLNEPVAEEDRVFHIHPTYDTYEVLGDLSTGPYESEAELRYWSLPRGHKAETTEGAELVVMPFSQFMKKHVKAVVMTVDYASTVTATSDFSVVCVTGFTPDLNMWLLDIWHGKVADAGLVNLIWKYGSQWLPRVVACEDQSILDLLQIRMAEFISAGQDSGWRPRPYHLKHGGRSAPSKAQRIKSQEWRFTSHRIKLPLSRQHEKHWAPLFRQIDDFTTDLNLLEHDDAIDAALGMPQYVVRISPDSQKSGPEAKTVAYYHQRGMLRDDLGLPLMPNLENVSEADLERALDVLHGRAYNKGRRRPARVRRVRR